MQQQQDLDSGATSNVGQIINVVVVEQETYFFRYTFPIYRALAVFVLYVGILGINELIFNEYKINYQKLLNIDFSIKPKRVIRKVLVFLFIFFVFFIWYQLEIDILDESDQISKVFDAIEKEYLGIVLWILCIAYFLFVGRQTCLWAAHTFLQSLLSPFRPSTVPYQLGFATDQIVSLVGPLKDAEYTLCYYSSDYQSVDQLNQCEKFKQKMIKNKINFQFFCSYVILTYSLYLSLSLSISIYLQLFPPSFSSSSFTQKQKFQNKQMPPIQTKAKIQQNAT